MTAAGIMGPWGVSFTGTGSKREKKARGRGRKVQFGIGAECELPLRQIGELPNRLLDVQV